jgi:ribosome-associated toxin RatA of RatAB toxin-antitoxin module
MPAQSRTEVFDVDINKFYEVLLDYESYPEFVDGVDDIEVLEQTEEGAKVKYSVNVIKKFSYTLNLTHERPHRVSWTFDSGDIFKVNKGAWILKDLGDGKTEVTYDLELEFKLMVPKMILNKLVQKNFPAMMKQYRDRAKSL